jgi:ribosomal protein S18 acetylase RimI-like enzyme
VLRLPVTATEEKAAAAAAAAAKAAAAAAKAAAAAAAKAAAPAPAPVIRAATPADADGIWAVLEPVIRGGEHYALPRDMPREAALAYWLAPAHDVCVALEPAGDGQGDGVEIDAADVARAPALEPASDGQGDGVGGAGGDGRVVGTYFIRANQQGGGAHVANAAYATAPASRGRGIARAMCANSLERARARGFRAMQFNFVVATNERAVRLWQAMGFDVIGRIPGAFAHPTLGDVDALIMHRAL